MEYLIKADGVDRQVRISGSAGHSKQPATQSNVTVITQHIAQQSIHSSKKHSWPHEALSSDPDLGADGGIHNTYNSQRENLVDQPTSRDRTDTAPIESVAGIYERSAILSPDSPLKPQRGSNPQTRNRNNNRDLDMTANSSVDSTTRVVLNYIDSHTGERSPIQVYNPLL